MTDEPKSHRLVANFMTASTPLEQYLQQGKPLTELEADSIEVTVDSLKIFLDSWKRKHAQKNKIK
jgi:hypothetical protein